MSGFWSDIKSTFKGPEMDETTKAVMDIENKKHTITQASLGEQNMNRTRINELFREVGEAVYAMHNEGNVDISKVADKFEAVKEQNRQLEDKQTKLQEILDRYDEELLILRPPPPEGQVFCPGCGSPYILGQTQFCGGCGYRVPDTPPPAGTTCPGCNFMLAPGAAFCPGCGYKVS